MSTERVVPDVVLSEGPDGYAFRPVTSIRSYPPGQHPPRTPVRAEYTAVAIHSDGRTRWHGFADAYIGPGLRMHVTLAPGQERDEVIMGWPHREGN